MEPTLNLLQDRSAANQAGEQALAATFEDNVQQFTLITNTLAKDKEISDRWRSSAKHQDDRHLSNHVGGGSGRCAGRHRARRLSAALAPATGRSGRNGWASRACRTGTVTRHYPRCRRGQCTLDKAKETVITAYGAFSPKMAAIAERFFAERWIDTVHPGKTPGAFAHPTVPWAGTYVLINYQGKPRAM